MFIVGPKLNFKNREDDKDSVEVYENEPVEINCSVEGYPTPNLTLHENDKQIIDGVEYYSPTAFTYGVTLKYPRVNRAASGTYVCRTDDNLYKACFKVIVYCEFFIALS